MAQPGGQAPVTDDALPPGRRELVARLIRQFVHNLAMRMPANTAHRIHLISRLDAPENVAFRQEVAAITVAHDLSVMEIVRQVLNRVTEHLHELKLAAVVGQNDFAFTDVLLNILDTPDADALREEETGKVVDRTLKVVELAIGGRDKLPRQDTYVADHRSAVAGLVRQLRLGEINASDAVSLISAETTWLLHAMRADKNVLRELPAMDADLLDLLEAIEAKRKE